MVVIGSKGHALEVFELLTRKGIVDLYFYDDVSTTFENKSISSYPIIRTPDKLKVHFQKDPDFILGVGQSSTRKKLSELAQRLGGKLNTVISSTAIVSDKNVKLFEGLNIMDSVIIQPEVTIGVGTLINARATVHHNTMIGTYCEISPGAIITGNVTIGNESTIGSGALIIPRINIGNNVTVGAGTVVIRDVPDHARIVGNPGRIIGFVNPDEPL